MMDAIEAYDGQKTRRGTLCEHPNTVYIPNACDRPAAQHDDNIALRCFGDFIYPLQIPHQPIGNGTGRKQIEHTGKQHEDAPGTALPALFP